MSYTEAQQELHDDLSLMSATELRSLKGDDEDMNLVIDKILGEGKAVEVPGGAKADEEDDDNDPAPANGDEDDEEDDDEEPQPAPVVEPAPVPAPEAEPAAAIVDFTPPALDLSGLAGEFKEQLDALTAEKKAAFAKLMGGEMEPDAYSDLEEKNLAQREALKEQQRLTGMWLTDVHNFRIQAAKESGINYFTDDEKDGALDSWVQRLLQKPENADKPGTWFLKEAHKKVMVEFDIAPKSAPKAAETVVDAKKVAQKTVRTPNLSAIPPTLGGLPAAASADSGDGGEFAHLDNLTGYDQEKAVARLTQAQRDRWEQM